MKKTTQFAGALLLCLLAYPVLSAPVGRYIGEVIAKWLDDGRVMELQDDFSYVDPAGVSWLAPRGSKVDGASIPPAAWSLIGGPFEGKYRNASVIHDVACQKKDRPWQKAHRMFYDAMLTSGVPSLKAKVMYAAVLVGGPKWSRSLSARNVEYSQAQDRAFSMARAGGMVGEVANTRIVFGEPPPQPVCIGCASDDRNLPPALADIEIVFEPQPTPLLTASRVAALEQEITEQDLSVEEIENRYLVDAPAR
jgi:hypothetical protein